MMCLVLIKSRDDRVQCSSWQVTFYLTREKLCIIDWTRSIKWGLRRLCYN